MVKNPLVNAGDALSIHGSERSPGKGNGSPLQYSCLENPMVVYSPWDHKESDTTEHTLRHFSHVQLFATPWAVACQAPLSMGFPRQEYWSGLPFPFPGDLSDPGMEPPSPALAGGFFTTKPPGEPFTCISSFNYHDNPGREVIVSPLCGLRYWGLI